MQLMLDITPKL